LSDRFRPFFTEIEFDSIFLGETITPGLIGHCYFCLSTILLTPPFLIEALLVQVFGQAWISREEDKQKAGSDKYKYFFHFLFFLPFP
jgi:hypothetical protein